MTHSGTPGWCLGFVSDAYAYGAGANVTRYYSAKVAANALNASVNAGTPPPRGSFVFWSWVEPSSGIDYGHVGISLGDGTVVNQLSTRQVTSISTISSWSGFRYIGWSGSFVSPPITDWDVPPSSALAVTTKSQYLNTESISISWNSIANATKYGLTVWKAPYSGDANAVWDNYVTGTSAAIGSLPAGTYRVRMAAYYGSKLGPLSSDSQYFNVVPNSHTLTYVAGPGGTIVGTSPQTVDDGSSGTTVTAVPNANYHFVRWSDGVTAARRTDTNVTGDTSVTASFAKNPAPSVGNVTAASTMSHTKSYTAYGYLKPRHATGTYPVFIYKYRYIKGTWKSYGYVKAKASNYSSYTKFSAALKLPYAGKWRLRAYALRDSQHVAAWSSGYKNVTVR